MKLADSALHDTTSTGASSNGGSSRPSLSIRVSDYIAQRLVEYGVRHLFMVTGGGSMHLNDSLGTCPGLHYICNHHEQASAMAAEGYARTTGGLGVLNVTTGPGGINALNGVFGAWTDSIPMLILSGQVKRETCMGFYDLPGLRQLGYQEADIISMVRGITKYAVLVRDPELIRYHLERAIHLATSGRPGPTWLDIPVDIQAAKIDSSRLTAYDPREDDPGWDIEKLPDQCKEVLIRIRHAARPVILAGSGVRVAHAVEIFHGVIAKLEIPVTTSRTSADLVPSDDPLCCGRPGVDNGDRPGNFAVQNSDLLLVLGCRLNVMQTGYNFPAFARAAFKIQVDADALEMQKPTVRPDYPVHCDAKLFLEELNLQMDATGYQSGRHEGWLRWCRERVRRYPVVLPKHSDPSRPLNPYRFIDFLIRKLDRTDLIVCGNGSAFVMSSQVAHIQAGQRFFFNSGCASMGHDLPAAIGAAVAREGRRVICLAGDGSLQMNVQELQTAAHHRLPIKIFVLSNGGYLSIRITQKNFFGNLVGESALSGISFPDYTKVAEAYGIPSIRIDKDNFETATDQVLNSNGPILAEVSLDPDQIFELRAKAKQLANGKIVSPPPEDLHPFLSRDELLDNLLIPPMEP